MDATQAFDAYLTLFMFLCAIVALGAAAKALDAFLDPPCKCAEKRRQEHETGGVAL